MLIYEFKNSTFHLIFYFLLQLSVTEDSRGLQKPSTEKKWVSAQPVSINLSETGILTPKFHQGMHHIAAAASKAFQEQFQNGKDSSNEQDLKSDEKYQDHSTSCPVSNTENSLTSKKKYSTSVNQAGSASSTLVSGIDRSKGQTSLIMSNKSNETATTSSSQSFPSHSTPKDSITNRSILLHKNKAALQQTLGFQPQVNTVVCSQERNSDVQILPDVQANERRNQVI